MDPCEGDKTVGSGLSSEMTVVHDERGIDRKIYFCKAVRNRDHVAKPRRRLMLKGSRERSVIAHKATDGCSKVRGLLPRAIGNSRGVDVLIGQTYRGSRVPDGMIEAMDASQRISRYRSCGLVVGVMEFQSKG